MIQRLLKRLKDLLRYVKRRTWDRFRPLDRKASIASRPQALMATVPVAEGRELLSFDPLAAPAEAHLYVEPKHALVLENVVVWPDCSVIAHDDALLTESTLSTFRLNSLVRGGHFQRQPVHEVTGYVACLEGGPWDNYYHWYVDTLPRLYALHAPRLAGLPIKLALTRDLTAEAQRVVEALLPENVELMRVSANVRLKPEHYVHLPYLSQEWAGWLPDEYLGLYRASVFEAFGISPDSGARRKIYISRRMAKVRRIRNEEEVVAFLEARGFTTHCLEESTLAEQMRLFSDAAVIVGQHGAGLTNMLYASRAKVLEIFSSNYPGVNHYRFLASAMGHTYASLHFGTAFRKDQLQVPWKVQFGNHLINDDIDVPLSALERKLDQLEAAASVVSLDKSE